MTDRRLVIAGTGSGVGKTTAAIGLMAAFARRGLAVQGFKCGPDYIDPTFHAAVTGRQSRNLDGWMFPADTVKEIYARGSAEADVSIIEGVMGFYDGRDPLSNEGSTAEIAMLLDAPVLLVVNCRSMARSAAAIVRGFQLLEPRVRIAGVVANQVGSDNHYRLVAAAIEQECGIPVVGYLKRDEALNMPERHLGLVPAIERGELSGLFGGLAEQIEASFDLDRILALAESSAIEAEARLFAAAGVPRAGGPVRIAVAKDAAFHFYYPENLELLEANGAELAYFSPLAGQPVPWDADGLYIGGGFPEQFAAELSANEAVKASVRSAAESGMPVMAECGGFMYLTEAITDTEGRRYPMAGVLPGEVRMQRKLAALGYRELTGTAVNALLGEGGQAKGHEFHYSVYEPPAGEAEAGDPSNAPQPAYLSKGMRGAKPDGMARGNLVAGYAHLHFASNPSLAGKWLDLCEAQREKRKRRTR
ncbi:cobyrinate a,c-diamide synthase [Paenibacillus methanolicus]|uniref:Cobyrinate a,c-diamide synthase n=1 Tax=Paenibacillus methanolicus TaxID=582686 RepID=A0A5S5BYB7_9BACL|nr:cobyrinate a,c-diamide synthase [Paenibacillus methanolicus]TYP71328.1 cobyrinic acid a,c-diamide synthase [Paenibacillus methanolicus]